MPARGHVFHHNIFFFQKSLKELFWSSFLRYCATSFTLIFSSVFLFEIGQTFRFFPFGSLDSVERGITCVALFYMLMRILALILIFPLAQLSTRIGHMWALVLANVFAIVKFISLIAATSNPLFLILAAVCLAVETDLYFPNFQTLFAVRSDAKKVGRDVGAFDFILKLLGGMLPVLSGILIVQLGYSVMFTVAIVFLIASNIPLLFLHAGKVQGYPTAKTAWKWITVPNFSSMIVTVLGRYLYDTAAVLWPLYILLAVETVDRVGFLISLGFFLSLLFSYFSGWLFDRGNIKFSLFVGGGAMSFAWIFRFSAINPTMIIGTETLDRIGGSLFFPTVDANLFRFEKQNTPFECEVYREYYMCIIAVFVWTLVLVVLSVTEIWNMLFIWAILGIGLCVWAGLKLSPRS